MAAFAAVTTAKGIAAIAGIRLTGPDAAKIIDHVFTPSAKDKHTEPGAIIVGDITDGTDSVDHIVLGCLAKDSFEINCHGNPLIVEMIMGILKNHGAKLVTIEELLETQFTEHPSGNTIAAEAQLTQLKAASLTGVKLIASQPTTGLGKAARDWLSQIDAITLEDVRAQCQDILNTSRTAELLITGARVVIAGPANSGKSTLLNALAGRQKAIVSHIPGTTRDWVSAEFTTPLLCMELIDTAGFDEALTAASRVDANSQDVTTRLIEDCDLILCVFDSTVPIPKLPLPENKKTLVVFNKLDLRPAADQSHIELAFADSVAVSAKTGEGLPLLVDKISRLLVPDSFDPTQPACFTPRQKDIITRLSTAKTKPAIEPLITELLNG